jgi:hypothetical protein
MLKRVRGWMREEREDELAERMCTCVIDHSFQQLPDRDRHSEHVVFNNPEASSTIANGKNTVETCVGVLY